MSTHSICFCAEIRKIINMFWLKNVSSGAMPVSTHNIHFHEETLIISKSKGLSEMLRDNSTSTYQICRIEEKIN